MEVHDASPGYAPQVDLPVVPEGYKQTEVGVIPKDWEVCELGEVLTFQRGYDLPHRERQAGSTPIVSSSGVSGSHSIGKVSGPGVVTGRYGTIGAVFYVNQTFWPLNTTLYIKDFKSNHPKFIYYLLSTVDFQSHAGKSGVPGVNRNDVHRELIAKPPQNEQRAIATALSDVDALLVALDRLIAKKRDIKQATMQQLLTGQTRLPGFEGEWQTKQLKELAELSPGINKPLSEMGSGVLYVTVQDLYDGRSIPTSKLSRIKVSPTEINSKCLAVGDIVFGKSSVKREGIGYPSQFLGCDEPVVFSGFTYRARAYPKSADASFLFYALRTEQTRRWLIDNSQASALTNINQKIADAIPVRVPPTVDEQKAIATVLSDMDAELEALHQRRTKAAALKQAMMQELLTGRTRLVGLQVGAEAGE